MTFDPATITTHPRRSPAEIRALPITTIYPMVDSILGSELFLALNGMLYGAAEWSDIGPDGRLWLGSIVRETLARAAAGNTHPYHIGERTNARVFKAAGLHNLSDMQAVLDAVERALSQAAV